jgi:archaellum component FlaC
MEAPRLKRGLFGYRSKRVRLALADRDRSLAEASERAGAAETLVLELRSKAEKLGTQVAEQAEQLRALEAEAAELRTDRDAARRDLEEAVADTERLRVELTATRSELETVRHDLETAEHASETASDEPDLQDERLRAAEELSERRSDEIALLEQELSAVRRHFLIQSQRARSAEARVEELEAEVRSVRAELEAGLSAAIGELEAARASVEEAAARPAPHPPATEEPSIVVPEAGRETVAADEGGPEAHAAEELGEGERAGPETLAEKEQLGSPEDLGPLVGVIRSTIEDAKERAAGIGARVDEAVAPLTEAITELSDWQAAFSELAELLATEPREPASESSLDPVDLDQQDGVPERPDPVDEVEARPP